MNYEKSTRLEIIEADPQVDIMYLYGRIGERVSKDEDTIVAKEVKSLIKQSKAKDLIIHLSSKGGDVFESITIHNLLQKHHARKTIIIDSVAASGGAVIAMAGDVIKMYDNSLLMIHPASTLTIGNANDHDKVAADLRNIDKSLKKNYKNRFKGTDRDLEKLIHEETWLTATEAKEKGFCDIILYQEDESTVSNKINLLDKKANKSQVVNKLMKKYGSKNNSNKTLFNMNRKGE